MLEQQIEYDLASHQLKFSYNWQSHEKLIMEYEEQYDTSHPKHNIYFFGYSLDIADKDI